MVPGLDKLKKDYDDIGVSYINSYKREKPTDTSLLTYNEGLSKITSKDDIINTLQNLKTREDVASYLNSTLKYNPMVKNIDVSYEALPPSDMRGISVSIELVDNTNIRCDLSFYD